MSGTRTDLFGSWEKAEKDAEKKATKRRESEYNNYDGYYSDYQEKPKSNNDNGDGYRYGEESVQPVADTPDIVKFLKDMKNEKGDIIYQNFLKTYAGPMVEIPYADITNIDFLNYLKKTKNNKVHFAEWFINGNRPNQFKKDDTYYPLKWDQYTEISKDYVEKYAEKVSKYTSEKFVSELENTDKLHEHVNMFTTFYPDLYSEYLRNIKILKENQEFYKWLTKDGPERFAEWFKKNEPNKYNEWVKSQSNISGGKKRKSKSKKNRKTKSKSKRVKKNRKTKSKSKRLS